MKYVPVPASRSATLAALLVLAVAAVPATGCRHASRPGAAAGPPPLEPLALRGERVVVVAEDPAAGALAGEVVRHLEVLPLRPTRPAEFGDQAAPGDDRAGWQAWAWERRIPYLLTFALEDGGGAAEEVAVRAALLPAREGGELWSVELTAALPRAVPVELRSRLRADLGVSPERPDGHPTSWPVAAAGELDGVARMALVEPDAEVERRVAELRQRYPLDPAGLELEAAVAALQGRPEEARTLARRAQTHLPEGRSQLPRLARDARRAGLTPRAERLWELSVEVWPGRVDYALEYADLLAEGEQHDRAVALLLDAGGRLRAADLEVPPDLDARPDRAVVLARLARAADLRYLLGWHLYESGEYEAALAAYDEAVRLFEAVAEPDSVASCHNNIGVTLIEAGRPLPALSYLKRALLARGGAETTRELANTLYNLGSAYEACGRLLEARDALEQAVSGYDEIGAADAAFDTRLELVVLEGEIGTSSSVESAAENLLARAGERADPGLARARALGAVGVARARVDRFEESLAALEESLATWIELGDRLREGQTRYSMAITYVAQGEHDRALETLQAARAIAEELGDVESILAIDVQMEQIEQLR